MPSALVTGTGRGIGRAIALRLASTGWDVYAGVSQLESGEALIKTHPEKVKLVQLDVTDEDQVNALDGALPATLDAVVNNAGVVVTGPVEAVPLAELRRQLEVNVVGQAAVTQTVLPRLRASRGRIVFVSSLSGRVATPLFGPYNASKFALEGMADAMRIELAPWGIRVVVVEPGQTDTDLWRKADRDLDETVAGLSPTHRELYAEHIAGIRKTIPRNQRAARPVDGVAAAVEKALTAPRPRARYVVGVSAQAQAFLADVTPTAVLDRVVAAGTGMPRKA
jgi:NAD(P)-dependent dehydrogenase (short-subunit alcohol dehydrogenase family)